jgi:hypothetical protein
MKRNIIKLITFSFIILLHAYSHAMLTRLPQAGRLPKPTRMPPTKAPYPTKTPAPRSDIKLEKSSGQPSGGSAVSAGVSQAATPAQSGGIRPHFGGRSTNPLFEHKRKDPSMQAVKQRSQSLRESEYPASYIVDSFNTDKFSEAEREKAFQTAIDLAKKDGYVMGIVYEQAENSIHYIRSLCNIAEGEAENYVPYPYIVDNTTLFECIFTPDALIYMIKPSTASALPELIYPEGENILELHELGSGPKVPPKAFNGLRKIQDNKAAQELQSTIETLTHQIEALQNPAIAIEPLPDVPAATSPEPKQPGGANIETPLTQAEQPFALKPLSPEQQSKLFQWGKPKLPQPLKPIASPEIEILEKVIKPEPQETQLAEAQEPTKTQTEQVEPEQPEEEPIIVQRIESAPDRFVKALSTTVETSGLAPEAIAQYQQEIASVMKNSWMGPSRKLDLLKTIEKNVEDAKTLKKTAELAEQNRIKELQLKKARLDLEEKENALEKATQNRADAQEVLEIVKKAVDIQTENVKNAQQHEIELKNTQKELLEQLPTEEREIAELKQQKDAAERVKAQSDALELAKKEKIEKEEALKVKLDKQIAAMEAREEAENKLNKIAST